MPGVFVDLTSDQQFDQLYNLSDLFEKPSHQRSSETAKPEQERAAEESVAEK